MRSRHVSVVIRRPAAVVYRYAADPQNLPAWAAGLASGTAMVNDDDKDVNSLTVDSPMGRVTVRFVPRNTLGVLDHDVTLPDGTTVHNPLRVLSHPDGAEVLFTIRQLGATDADFERDAAMVLADLHRLRDLLESAAAGLSGAAATYLEIATHLRIATTDDALAVARLLRAFNSEFDCPAPEPEDAAPRIASIVAGDGGIAVVAADARGEDIGFALVTFRATPYWDGPLAQLDELYVRPDRRGGGLGAAILGRATDEARSRGAQEMHVNVDGDDVDARRFYHREGFSPIDPDSGSTMYFYLRRL